MTPLPSGLRHAAAFALATFLVFSSACTAIQGTSSGDGDGDGDGDGSGTGGGENTGGDSATNTGGTGTGGGDGDGSGGDSTGTGGSGTSSCPVGSESMVLDLNGKSPTVVSGMPPAGYSGSFNLEGPVWIDGALYASEISTTSQPNPARIIRYVPGMTPTVLLADAGTNGLAVDSEGNLVVARQSDGSVSVIDPDDPTAPAQVLSGMYSGVRYNSPNDLAISSSGHIYFSDPDWQAPNPAPQDEERAYHLPPGGMPTPIVGTPSKPNGVTLSLDEQTLYSTGTSGLQSYPIMSDGSVGTGSSVAGVTGGGDGMGMDCAGYLYVTNGSKIVVLDSSGSFVDDIDVGTSVTNIAFGGADRRTMFITSLSPAALRTMDMDIPGLPY